MDVDAMDELMYDTLIRYFKTLAHTGYKSYDVVFKMLVMDFIYEITHTELRYYITNKDIKLMQDLLYQLFGSTCEISFPTNNRPCCVCVCCNGEGTTPPPTRYYMVSMESDIPCNVTGKFGGDNISGEVTSNAKRYSIESGSVPRGTITTCSAKEVGYVLKGIYDADNGSLLASSLPFSWSGSKNLRFEFEQTITTTTTTSSTTTSTPSPVVGNNVYYGVVEDYMSPLDFVDTPIDTLMKRGGTKSKAITGTKVNEFAIPQNGYYTYLIVPVDKVELQYAAFTSGGITTVCYDRTKENIPNDTNNGIFFSKYTRGGVNANQGGAYNGINYDVYFVYNNYGGAPELINVKAKNK